MAKFNSGGGMKGFVSLFKTKLFKTGLCLGLFITSALIILAMLLGNDAGTFVIRVQNSIDRSITLCEDLQLDSNGNIVYDENGDIASKVENRLGAPSMDGMTDYSPRYFLPTKDTGQYDKVLEYTSVNGYNHVENALYIYTFYVLNTGDGEVGVNLQLNYENKKSGKNNAYLDKIVRIMTFCYEDNSINIYQKKDTIETTYQWYFADSLHMFESNSVVFSKQKIKIPAKTDTTDHPYRRYSLFLWLEGDDPDETQYEASDYFSTSISFDMKISVEMSN